MRERTNAELQLTDEDGAKGLRDNDFPTEK
jgi:hypothetical protein